MKKTFYSLLFSLFIFLISFGVSRALSVSDLVQTDYSGGQQDYTIGSETTYQILGSGITGMANGLYLYGYNEYGDTGNVKIYSNTSTSTTGWTEETSNPNGFPTGTTPAIVYYEFDEPLTFDSGKYYFITYEDGGNPSFMKYSANGTAFENGESTDVWNTGGTHFNWDMYFEFNEQEKYYLTVENIGSTEEPSFSLNATSTLSVLGSYKITATLFYSGLSYASSTQATYETTGFYSSIASTGEYPFTFDFENLPKGYFNKIQYNIYKNVNGMELVKQYNYDINLQTTDNESEFTPDTTTDIEILTASTSTIGILGTIHWQIGDDVGYYIAGIEIWNASTTKMYYQEIKPVYSDSAHEDYLTKDFSLENGTYVVVANLEYTYKLSWWQKLLHLGGTKETISVRSDDIVVNIIDNEAINPNPVWDGENGIDNTINLSAIEPILKAFEKAKTYLNPTEYFPFSWIKLFYADIKDKQTEYENLPDTNTEATFTIMIGNTTSTIPILKESEVQNIIGATHWDTIQTILKSFLWIVFGFYIFKRLSTLLKH